MEIRLSKYNAPFCEIPEDGVHYISLDDQRDMRIGNFSSHVRLYRSQSNPHIIEIDDPLTGLSVTYDLSDTGYRPPFARNPVASLDCEDREFLKDLYYTTGIRAADRRLYGDLPKQKRAGAKKW